MIPASIEQDFLAAMGCSSPDTIRPGNERFRSEILRFIVVICDGRRLALLWVMKDRSALIIALVIAVAIFVLQLFVKQHLLSPNNMETAGKLQRIFQAGDILPFSLSIESKVPIKPIKQNVPTGRCQRQKTTVQSSTVHF